LIKILNLDGPDFSPKDISEGTSKFVGPYRPDVYTNLVLIMEHKYYDEIKEQK